MGSEWRYLAQRVEGRGNLGEFVDINLPLQSVQITEALSGHNSLNAQISPKLSRLLGSDGRPVFNEWGVAIWAESPNGEVFGGLLENSRMSGPTWALDCIDISAIMIGTPYTDSIYFLYADPMDLFRYIWQWYQSRDGCNFGVNVDSNHSPKRIGYEYTQWEEFDEEGDDPMTDPAELYPSPYANNAEWVAKCVKKLKKSNGWKSADIESALNKWLTSTGPTFYSDEELKIIRKAIKVVGQPPQKPGTNVNPTPTLVQVTYQVDAYKLNWYTDHDLSSNIDALAADTPFDWHLQHRWSDDSDDPDLFHKIRTGYPRLGRRIEDLRFVFGENIDIHPDVERNGEEWASDIVAFGAGEGSTMLMSTTFLPDVNGRVRRIATVSDDSITTQADLDAFAASELAKRAQIEDIDEIVLKDHPHAPVGSVQLGDEIYLEGWLDWVEVNAWFRVIGRTFSPDDSSTVSLQIVRSDRLS